MSDEFSSAENDIIANHIEPFVKDDEAPTTPVVDTVVADGSVPDGEETIDVSAETANQGNVELGADGKPLDKSVKQGTSDGSGKDGNQQQQQAKEGQGGRAARADGAVEDGQGNLKLPDGQFIKAGSHRRLYEDNIKLKDQVSGASEVLKKVRDEIAPSYERQIEQLTARAQAFEAASVAHNQYGLGPEEHVQAVKLAAAWKSNPVATLQYLLAEARAAGHNIEGIGSSVDTMAVNRIIEQKLAPFTANHERTQQEQKIQQESAQAANQFFTKFPDAKIHESLLAKLITDNPHLSPESAYYELRLSAQARSLDWNRPLMEQLSQGVTQQQQVQQQQVTPQVLPKQGTTMPNGRPNAVTVVTDTPRVASESASMGDIVREAMREAGLKV